MGTNREEEFDWVNKNLKSVLSMETPKERLVRKIEGNPFVPIGNIGYDSYQLIFDIFRLSPKTASTSKKFLNCPSMSGICLKKSLGCLATFCALSRGLWYFRRNERRMAQKMMRARIIAQGFTILSLVIGIGLSNQKF